MDVMLMIIAVLGLGALVIAVYIFAVAARQYVSEDHHLSTPKQSHTLHIPRRQQDRRQTNTVLQFPITVNGLLVHEDRRRMPDRRRAA